MIEPPPGLSTETIVQRVRERYGVACDRATFLPLGNDSGAWSYRVEGTHNRWFLKVLSRVDPAAIELPRFLADRGIDHLVPARSTVDGAAFDAGEPYAFALFPFIDGAPGGELGLTAAQRTELGRVLRTIHETEADGALERLMRHERFAVRDEAYIERVHAAADAAERDGIAEALMACWRDHGADIAHSLQRARELAAYGTSTARARVICHADFHAWNVLIDPTGAMHVVDWDEALLAPRERDLMFVSGDIADIDPAGEDFYRGYGEVEIDAALIAYYRFDWALQEVADYHRRVFDIALRDETRAEALEYFVELFGPEDVVAAAYRADREIP
jgi:spectinomycin phosphotransferase